MAGHDGDKVVSWEAADRGANCGLGCTASAMYGVSLGLAIWYLAAGEVWKLAVAMLVLLGALGLTWYMRSPARNRWEISFDSDRQTVRLYQRVDREETVREFGFDEIAGIELVEIRRDVSSGDNVSFLLPVFHLKSGEEVRLDERMSVRDPERAGEVLEQMRGLVGLSSK